MGAVSWRTATDVRYVEIAECGHSFGLERPSELARVLREFFADQP